MLCVEVRGCWMLVGWPNSLYMVRLLGAELKFDFVASINLQIMAVSEVVTHDVCEDPKAVLLF